jgi:stage III sporulation protein AD
MQIISLAGLAVVTAVIALVLREYKSDYSLYITILGCLIILSAILYNFDSIIQFLDKTVLMSGISDNNFAILLKAVGAGYITQFAGDICRDSGETSIASKIELAGKIYILFLSIPLIDQLLQVIQKITENV